MAKKGKTPVERLLGLFAEVKAGEGTTVILMFLNIFLILAAYYILKSVREGLLAGGGEIFGRKPSEIKAYLPAVMAVMFIFIVPGYGILASRVGRLTLIKYCLGFVIISLAGLGLWGAIAGPGPAIGLVFYLWLGLINVFLIAQFWSYANDIYNEKQGKRLFAIIAIGSSAGAILGPLITKLASMFVLLGAAAAVFAFCLFLYAVINRREAREAQATKDEADDKVVEEPLGKDGGFQLVFRTRYLLLIALMILTTNVVNTTGEYILFAAAENKTLRENTVAGNFGNELAAEVEAHPKFAKKPRKAEEIVLGKARFSVLKKARGNTVKNFYGTFFLLVNFAGLFIQMFLVSRLFKYIGVRASLFVLPVIAFGGYAAIGLIGGLLVLRAAKTAENSTDYSLQNTVKQALFLPTSREAKYKAKAAIDTFFVRFGDAASAGIVAVGLNVFAFGAKEFAYVNVALCVVWIMLNMGIAREHKRMTADKAELPKAKAVTGAAGGEKAGDEKT